MTDTVTVEAHENHTRYHSPEINIRDDFKYPTLVLIMVSVAVVLVGVGCWLAYDKAADAKVSCDTNGEFATRVERNQMLIYSAATQLRERMQTVGISVDGIVIPRPIQRRPDHE